MKNKNGFTLLELLVVILVVSIVSTSAIISFSGADEAANAKKLKEAYIEIQRDAITYAELNDSWLSQLMDKGYIDIMFNELLNTNYLDASTESFIFDSDEDSIDSAELFVRIAISDDKNFVDSCIIKDTETESIGLLCKADNEGNKGDSVVCCSSNTKAKVASKKS